MPIHYEDLPADVSAKRSAQFSPSKYVFVHPDPELVTPLGSEWKLDACYLPDKYRKYADAYQNFKVRKDDVWIVTFPRCGSTWSQEMIWMINSNLDYDEGSAPIDERVFYFEMGLMFGTENAFDRKNPNVLPSPRYFKTHLPLGLLPKQLWTVKPKIVYTARNPKDTIVSYYHNFKSLQSFRGDIDEFITFFVNNWIIFSPYHSSVLNFWAMRNEENVLFLTYEEMKQDFSKVLRKAAKFCGKSYSDEDFERNEKHLSFDSMKNNASVNNGDEIQKMAQQNLSSRLESNFKLLLAGIVGSHRTELAADAIANIDKWSAGKIKDFRKLQQFSEKLNDLPPCFD